MQNGLGEDFRDPTRARDGKIAHLRELVARSLDFSKCVFTATQGQEGLPAGNMSLGLPLLYARPAIIFFLFIVFTKSDEKGISVLR